MLGTSRWVRASIQPATLLGLMMIAACWLGLTYVLSVEHSKTVAGATQQADNLARLFEESIVSTFKGIDRAMLTREVLEKLGYPVEWHDYPMPHSVCPEEIGDIAAFLLRIL